MTSNEVQRTECKRLFDNALSVGSDPQSWHIWKRAFDLGVVFGGNTTHIEMSKRIADLEAKLAQAIEFQKRAFSYGANGCSWEEFFDAQEKEAQESEKGGL